MIRNVHISDFSKYLALNIYLHMCFEWINRSMTDSFGFDHVPIDRTALWGFRAIKTSF